MTHYSRSILIKNACLIVSATKAVADGFVYLKDGLVADIGPAPHPHPLPSGERGKGEGSTIIIDARGRVVLPGFVNPHMHLYSQFAKGLAVGRMSSFGEILKKLWWRLDKALNKEDIYYSALLGLIEGIKSGVTTVFDHHASYGYIGGSLSTIARAFSETGVRGCLCFEISDRHGKKARDEAMQENAGFLEKCLFPPLPSPLPMGERVGVRGMIGLHASMTLSDKTLAMAREVMDAYGVGAHIHVAEGMEDVADAKRKYKESVVGRLYNEGILREGTIAAHCVHVDGRDLDLLKKSGAFVVHNPLSNLNNAVGIAPFLDMHKKKIPVGIGTDGMSAGIFGDVKAASVLHKITMSLRDPKGRGDAEGVILSEAKDPMVLMGLLRRARNDNSRNLQAGFIETHKSTMEVNPGIASHIFGFELGILKKGAAADVIISDYVPPTPLTNENFWGHVLFGIMNLPVRTTICAGRILMRDFEVGTVDEEKIVAKAKKCARKLWNRM